MEVLWSCMESYLLWDKRYRAKALKQCELFVGEEMLVKLKMSK